MVTKKGYIHFIQFLFLFLLWVQVFVLGRSVWNVPSDRFDFRIFYTAGYMARAGHAVEVNDQGRSRMFADQLVSPADGGALPFNHPSFEALLFVPLSFFRYATAYRLMVLVNFGLCACCFAVLWPYLRHLQDLWRYLPFALFACSFPVAVTFIQGQDSLLLTLILAASAVQADELSSGFLLSLGMFKFHFVLPVVLLFLLWRKWRFVKGFAVGAILL